MTDLPTTAPEIRCGTGRAMQALRGPGEILGRGFKQETIMGIYTVRTDGFMLDDFEAENLDAAIAEAFDGEIAGIKDEATLRKKFARYERDGGWCWIECDGERVLEIGKE